ncbi:uncharacterized protein BDR25DRAFT_352932 [Lindgomyces ingoldianus]|uniref:Uncharacterized protein n=1 Tax=Lindgomyces ingoldianus TaxID=673940 RepID=A0ACB6R2H1_9PLEO|nr:uncharacterized protein BDR25DRAFT_352932 [Lindgomyces ingoldianus]KAF2473524.1 hypothetical protein BDR25DRAFT_352932 [Lindgomyces ingoldianus]
MLKQQREHKYPKGWLEHQQPRPFRLRLPALDAAWGGSVPDISLFFTSRWIETNRKEQGWGLTLSSFMRLRLFYDRSTSHVVPASASLGWLNDGGVDVGITGSKGGHVREGVSEGRKVCVQQDWYWPGLKWTLHHWLRRNKLLEAMWLWEPSNRKGKLSILRIRRRYGVLQAILFLKGGEWLDREKRFKDIAIAWKMEVGGSWQMVRDAASPMPSSLLEAWLSKVLPIWPGRRILNPDPFLATYRTSSKLNSKSHPIFLPQNTTMLDNRLHEPMTAAIDTFLHSKTKPCPDMHAGLENPMGRHTSPVVSLMLHANVQPSTAMWSCANGALLTFGTVRRLAKRRLGWNQSVKLLAETKWIPQRVQSLHDAGCGAILNLSEGSIPKPSQN